MDAAFLGPTSIKFPGLAASSGHFCLQIDSSGYLTNTGVACGTGSGGTNGTINSGNNGQIAYYTASGTSLGGMNAVPVAAGGTGASTASAAIASLGALSAAATVPQTFASLLTGPSVNASVNSQINVMAPPYNAKGDCTTDDQVAINAALRAADSAASGGRPAVVYFPKPPGGCYLTSTLAWYGESLEGQPPAVGGGYAAVIIKGKPGQDILHAADPTTSTTPWNNGWSIQHIAFDVDNSAAGSFPHRWPGRWFDDGAMTAGNAAFKSQYGQINCSDIGQAIQVNGAGPSGANLVTTIASVAPCWAGPGNQWQTIALASAASTTVTSAHAYISVGDMPVTTTVGNCALAFDDVDGNPAHWATPNNPQINNWYDALHDIQIMSNSGKQNGACGIFVQGPWGPYGIDARQITISGLVYGIVQASSELNSSYQAGASDYEKWDHVAIEVVTYPWISYNGGQNKIEDWELTSDFGPQILALGNNQGDVPNNWIINVPEFEGNAGSTGFRIVGSNISVINTALSESGSQKIYVDTSALRCINCTFGQGGGTGTVYVFGSHNYLDTGGAGASGVAFTDLGMGNRIHCRRQ